MGWVLGGLVPPIIMPIAAHTSMLRFPADVVLQYADDARCCAAGYSDPACSETEEGCVDRRWVTIGVMITAIALAVANDNYCYSYYCGSLPVLRVDGTREGWGVGFGRLRVGVRFGLAVGAGWCFSVGGP